ncbi:MAG: hypothetical protein M0C28_12200 [Candidatus Moduliflexus flocculans]|nr:hypothetical protein [Candidatus Moduliflexus flocculans]
MAILTNGNKAHRWLYSAGPQGPGRPGTARPGPSPRPLFPSGRPGRSRPSG